MPERIQIPFGGALDREAGVMVMKPGSFEDQRNVYLREGKAIVRPGFGSELVLLDDTGAQTSHVVAGHPLLSERVGIVVSYRQATKKVWVHRIDVEGTTAELIGEWVHDRGGWGSSPPVIHMTEVYGRVFMAHDQRFVTKRAPTVYYDPIFGSGSIEELTNNFSAGGPHKTRFRGVWRPLEYLGGWGYGDEGTDGPEYIRISRPGEPLTFDTNGYGRAGNRRHEILRCELAGSNSVILKESEGYALDGTSRANFGVRPIDPKFGILAPGLAVNVGELLLAWSGEGPRAWDGFGPSRDLAIPLDLGGLEPSSLVPQGSTEHAFAHYIPKLRVAVFAFGPRVYVLDVRTPGEWKWAGYWPLGFTPHCAFTLVTGSQLATAPTGHPEWGSATPAGTYVDLSVVHFAHDGDETLEIWLQPAAGAWYLARSLIVTTSSPQLVRVPGAGGAALTPGTAYDGALRYRRGVLYGAGYQSADPSTWPSVSRGSFTTVIDPPAPVSATWERTGASTEQITVTCTPTAGYESNDIDIYRDDVYLTTIAGPGVGNDASYVDTAVTGETWHKYQFVTTQVAPLLDSPLSDAIYCWAGPPTLVVIDWAQMVSADVYEAAWGSGDPALVTEWWDNYDDATGSTGAYVLRVTMPAGDPNFELFTPLLNLPAAPGVQISLTARHKMTSFGTDDFGPFHPIAGTNEKLLYVYDT